MGLADSLHNELWLIPNLHITNEQEFTSPGTWTCPVTTTWAEVIVVGGGGGGGSQGHNGSETVGSGGGGAVVRKWVPVSGPMPITVGAGGTGASWPVSSPTGVSVHVAAVEGGTSSFGPQTAPIPSNTVTAGGGGRGGSATIPAPQLPLYPAPLAFIDGRGTAAPANGGGGGGSYQAHLRVSAGGLGAPSLLYMGGGARSTAVLGTNDLTGLGYGVFGGGGAITSPGVSSAPTWSFQGGGYFSSTPGTQHGTANRGGGGAGSNGSPAYSAGGNGGSGIVIVRWRQ